MEMKRTKMRCYLLMLASFFFLFTAPVGAVQFQYNLSGGASPSTNLVVDDDIEVYINGDPVFLDNDRVRTADPGARYRGNPITFKASLEDTIRIVAKNSGSKIELSPLYLHAGGQSIKLTDGIPQKSNSSFIFFDYSFKIKIPSGSMSVSSNPNGADVYLDGSFRGKTPLTIPDVAIGSHAFRLSKQDYMDIEKTVTVPDEQTVYISENMTLKTGSLNVSSNPNGADVYLDGSYKGITPMVITYLAEGSHNITLKLSNYQDWSHTINVVAGRTTPVSAQHVPQNPQPPGSILDEPSVIVAIIGAITAIVVAIIKLYGDRKNRN